MTMDEVTKGKGYKKGMGVNGGERPAEPHAARETVQGGWKAEEEPEEEDSQGRTML